MTTTKIIPFYGRHYKKYKWPPLTSKMVIALLQACKKQREGVLYGPVDIRGSFSALIRRGLVVVNTVRVNGSAIPVWQVTVRAVEMLDALGFKVDITPL